MGKIGICLWFDDQAEEAAKYYTTTFKNSKMGGIMRYDAAAAKVSGRPEGSVLTANFTLEGIDYTALNGGPIFKFSEATSLVVTCEDQDEIDYYWEKLSAVTEAEQCGWCKDKFGVSWQIIPKNLNQLISSTAGMKAMLSMKKLDIQKLKGAE